MPGPGPGCRELLPSRLREKSALQLMQRRTQKRRTLNQESSPCEASDVSSPVLTHQSSSKRASMKLHSCHDDANHTHTCKSGPQQVEPAVLCCLVSFPTSSGNYCVEVSQLLPKCGESWHQGKCPKIKHDRLPHQNECAEIPNSTNIILLTSPPSDRIIWRLEVVHPAAPAGQFGQKGASAPLGAQAQGEQLLQAELLSIPF